MLQILGLQPRSFFQKFFTTTRIMVNFYDVLSNATFISTLFRDQSSFEIVARWSYRLQFHGKFQKPWGQQKLWALYMFTKKYQIMTGKRK